MANSSPLCILILLLSSLTIFASGARVSGTRKTHRRFQNIVRRLDDSTTTITNPANFPPYTPTPTIVTVPGSNPNTPVNDPAPIAPPTTTVPATTTPTQPITNPANPGNVPVSNPPYQPTNAPVTQGQSWCIANSGASETVLQSGLDYACGSGLADCSTIQEGGSCYNPNSLANHASYAFNSYYQKNPSPTSCDFGGAAVLVNTNPSTGTCIYPSSGTGAGTAIPLSTTPPVTETPSSTFPTPTTTSSPGTTGYPYGSPASGNFGSPPSLTSPTNPNSLFPASYGPDSPPLGGSSIPAGSAALRPDISFIILVAFFFTGKLVLST